MIEYLVRYTSLNCINYSINHEILYTRSDFRRCEKMLNDFKRSRDKSRCLFTILIETAVKIFALYNSEVNFF